MGKCLKKIHNLIKEHEKDLGIVMPDHTLVLVYKAYLLGLDEGKYWDFRKEGEECESIP